VPASLDPRLLFTAPPPVPTVSPGPARAFYAAYRRRYGSPEPPAIYGYEAMSLMLSAIDAATHDGRIDARRSAVLAALFATHDRRSVVGTYSIKPDGDTTLDRYGAFVVHNGRLRFWKSVPG
jgi:branched-chain amino acid transport system substrate-binding protein